MCVYLYLEARERKEGERMLIRRGRKGAVAPTVARSSRWVGAEVELARVVEAIFYVVGSPASCYLIIERIKPRCISTAFVWCFGDQARCGRR